MRRREIVRKDELFSVSKMNFTDGNPHAQAPSVPIRRAGRRARDEDRVRTKRPSNLQSPFVNRASKFIGFWES